MAKIWSCSYPSCRMSAPEAATSSPSARGPGRPIPRASTSGGGWKVPTGACHAGPVLLMTRRTNRLSVVGAPRRSSLILRSIRRIRPSEIDPSRRLTTSATIASRAPGASHRSGARRGGGGRPSAGRGGVRTGLARTCRACARLSAPPGERSPQPTSNHFPGLADRDLGSHSA